MSAKQILVVEDERPIREMIAFGLRRAGFEVREAADAQSGRAEVANKRPDLLLSMNAVLRRTTTAEGSERIDIEGLVLDQSSQRVSSGERTVALGPTEYRMLAFFMTHPERVYTREQLLDRVWGGNVYVEERTIDVHIRRLRKALEEFGYDRLIQTVRGSGYRFSSRPL